VSNVGRIRSEKVDMSSTRNVQIVSAESLKVPAPGMSAQGEPAPKDKADADADGNQINISEPTNSDKFLKLYMFIGLCMQ